MKAETIIGPVTMVDLPRRTYAGIRIETPFPGMFAVATRALKVLRNWSKTNGLQNEGPFLLRYYHCDMAETMVIEAGLMTSQTIPEHPDIKTGLLPEGRYASLIYRGNGLRGNQAMMAWARETGAMFDPIDPGQKESYVCRYEAYLTDYRIEPRKLLWDVELSVKLADGRSPK